MHKRSSPPGRQQKINHFVVLYQENRGFDHTLGCLNLTDSSGGGPSDGIPPEGRAIPTDPAIPVDPANSSTFVTATCGSANYVCVGGPGCKCCASRHPLKPQSAGALV